MIVSVVLGKDSYMELIEWNLIPGFNPHVHARSLENDTLEMFD